MQIGSSGNSASRITISVYGSGKVTLSGAGGFDFRGNSYVTIDGLRGNAAAGDTSYGISVTNIPSDSYCAYEYNGGHDLRIYHVECAGTATSGSNDYSGGMYFGLNGNGMDIAYNWVHGPVPASGSSVSCDTFTNNQQMWCATGIKMFTSGGTSTFNANQIHDNKIENLFNDGLDCSNDCSMYNNDVSVIQLSGHSDSVQCQGGNNCAIYSNYIHGSGDQNIYLDNFTGGTLSHVRIYNNVINSPTGHGGINIDPEGGSNVWNDVVIANNTFYASKTYNIYYSGRGSVTNVAIFNNIFGGGTDTSYHIVEGISPSMLTSNSLDYDVYSTSAANYPNIVSTSLGTTLGSLQARNPAREVHGKVGIPSYVNAAGADFHLSPTDTVARGAGENLSATYSFLATDKDGNPRPASGAWDLGAYASGSGPGNGPQPPTQVSALVH